MFLLTWYSDLWRSALIRHFLMYQCLDMGCFKKAHASPSIVLGNYKVPTKVLHPGNFIVTYYSSYLWCVYDWVVIWSCFVQFLANWISKITQIFLLNCICSEKTTHLTLQWAYVLRNHVRVPPNIPYIVKLTSYLLLLSKSILSFFIVIFKIHVQW